MLLCFFTVYIIRNLTDKLLEDKLGQGKYKYVLPGYSIIKTTYAIDIYLISIEFLSMMSVATILCRFLSIDC